MQSTPAQGQQVFEDVLGQVLDAMGDGAFTLRIIIPIKETLELTLQTLMAGFVYAYMAPIIDAMMLLAVVIFGWKMVDRSVQNPFAEGSILLMKIGGVSLFTNNMDQWYPALFEGMEWLIAVVGTAFDNTAFSCDETMQPLSALPVTNANQYLVWHKLDCIFINFLGFAGAGTFVSVMMGMMISAAISGYLGVYVFTTGVLGFTGMIFSIMRVAYMYINSLIAITFLISIAPIFIPLILFKVTFRYFEQWLKLVIAFALQPVVMAGFVAMMVQVYHVAIFTGEYSVASAFLPEAEFRALQASQDPEDFDLTFMVDYFQEDCFEGEQMMQPTYYTQEMDANMVADGSFSARDELFEGRNETARSMKYEVCKELPDFARMTESGGGYLGQMEIPDVMKRMIMSFVMLFLITFVAFALIENLQTIIKFLVGMSFRFQISYMVPPIESSIYSAVRGGGGSPGMQQVMNSGANYGPMGDRTGEIWSQGLRYGAQAGIPLIGGIPNALAQREAAIAANERMAASRAGINQPVTGGPDTSNTGRANTESSVVDNEGMEFDEAFDQSGAEDFELDPGQNIPDGGNDGGQNQ